MIKSIKSRLITLLVTLLTLTLSACASPLGAPPEPTATPVTINIDVLPTAVPFEAAPTPTPFPLTVNVVDPTPAAEASDGGDTAETIQNQSGSTSTLSSDKVSSGTLALVLEKLDDEDMKLIASEMSINDRLQILKNLQDNGVDVVALQEELGEDATPADLLAELEPEVVQQAMVDLDPAIFETVIDQLSPAELAEITANLDTAELIALSEDLGIDSQAQLPLYATGIVLEQDVPVRTAPYPSAGYNGLVTGGDVFGIFGTNSGRDWVYVLTAQAGYGWVPLNSSRLVGSLAESPILPNDPLGIITRRTAASTDTTDSSSTSTTSMTVVQAEVDPVDLPIATTGELVSGGLNLRQGPGANYDLIMSLNSATDLEIIGQNRTRDWVLVKTSAGELGWGYGALVSLADESDLPVIISATADTVIPTGQIAPIRRIIAADGETTSYSSAPTIGASAPASTSTETTVGLDSSNLPAPPSFGQVAVATIAKNDVDYWQGPGEQYGFWESLTQQDEKLYIIGADASQQWYLIRRDDDPKIGWIKRDDLKTDTPVANAPVAVTAWVTSNGVDVYTGPGVFYGKVGKLNLDTAVALIGISNGKNWYYIQPILGGGPVWISQRFLELASPTDGLPQLDGPKLPNTQAARPEVVDRFSPSGTIVFQKASGEAIMVINADGTGLRQLTHGIDPVLSPDGQKVAFTRWEGEGNGSLWTLNLDGTNEQQVLSGVEKAKGAEWSPDSQKVIFNYQHGGREDEKRICDEIKGNVSRPPGNAIDVGVEVQDDAPHFCFTLPEDRYWGLKLVDLATKETVDVDGGTYAFRPAWDPTNNWRVVSDSGYGLLQTDVNNGDYKPLTDIVGDGSPAFSPDGRTMVVVVSAPSVTGSDLYRLNADGTGRVRLTQTPFWKLNGPEAGERWNHVAPTFTPDGSRIAFLTDRNGPWQIWVMNPDGSNPRPLFDESINAELSIQYDFVDERVFSWR